MGLWGELYLANLRFEETGVTILTREGRILGIEKGGICLDQFLVIEQGTFIFTSIMC